VVSEQYFAIRESKLLFAKIPGVKGNLNNVVDLEVIMERGKRFNREMRELDAKQCQDEGNRNGASYGDNEWPWPIAGNELQICSHPDSYKIDSSVWEKKFHTERTDGCWIGCNMSCSKGIDDFILKTGPYKGQKVVVDGLNMRMQPDWGSKLWNFPIRIYLLKQFLLWYLWDLYNNMEYAYSIYNGVFPERILNMERTAGLIWTLEILM